MVLKRHSEFVVVCFAALRADALCSFRVWLWFNSCSLKAMDCNCGEEHQWSLGNNYSPAHPLDLSFVNNYSPARPPDFNLENNSSPAHPLDLSLVNNYSPPFLPEWSLVNIPSPARPPDLNLKNIPSPALPPQLNLNNCSSSTPLTRPFRVCETLLMVIYFIPLYSIKKIVVGFRVEMTGLRSSGLKFPNPIMITRSRPLHLGVLDVTKSFDW